MPPPVTNAMRILDQRGIPYETVLFSPDIHSAAGVAEAAGLPVERVFKTLVAIADAGSRPMPVLAIVPGNADLDLKALARTAAQKKVRMASQKEAESLTGLQVGGISALALLQKNWPVYLDSSSQEKEWLVVSAGQRGINLRIAVSDLAAVTGARVALISRNVPKDAAPRS